MRTLQISDELFDKLKDFVVDPFEDTPEVILDRIMGIMDKAKQNWSPQTPSTLDSSTTDSGDSNLNTASDELRYRPANEVAAIH